MKLGLVAALALAVALPIGIAAQQQQQQQTQKERGQVGTAGATATVNDIVDNPERYFGQTVMVSGKVDKVHGKRVFTIEGDEGLAGGNDSLLVLWKKEASESPSMSGYTGTTGQTGQTGQTQRHMSGQEPNITEDSTVQATGQVRRFVKADIEREYNIKDWSEWGVTDQNWYSEYNNKPVLIASSVQLRSGERR